MNKRRETKRSSEGDTNFRSDGVRFFVPEQPYGSVLNKDTALPLFILSTKENPLIFE